ncbi:hypothetical protein DFH09DRAFT_1314030 [Mycena vulgaris]|nr:hypothetical protein DFH09DRAFT_1314030 [Mycena vulgaris]
MEPRNFEFVAVEPPSQQTQPLPSTQPYRKMRWAEYTPETASRTTKPAMNPRNVASDIPSRSLHATLLGDPRVAASTVGLPANAECVLEEGEGTGRLRLYRDIRARPLDGKAGYTVLTRCSPRRKTRAAGRRGSPSWAGKQRVPLRLHRRRTSHTDPLSSPNANDRRARRPARPHPACSVIPSPSPSRNPLILIQTNSVDKGVDAPVAGYATRRVVEVSSFSTCTILAPGLVMHRAHRAADVQPPAVKMGSTEAEGEGEVGLDFVAVSIPLPIPRSARPLHFPALLLLARKIRLGQHAVGKWVASPQVGLHAARPHVSEPCAQGSLVVLDGVRALCLDTGSAPSLGFGTRIDATYDPHLRLLIHPFM